MKTVKLQWHDTHGKGFSLHSDRFWPFEIEEIAATLRGVGYYDWIPQEGFLIHENETADQGPSRIVAALAAIGYAVEFSGDFLPESIFAGFDMIQRPTRN